MRKILFVQHNAGIGGAPSSLLFMIESLDKSRFAPVVLFSSSGPAAELFRSKGIEVYVETSLPVFGHAYGGRPTFRSVTPWKPITGWLSIILGINRYMKVLEPLEPDIVHVNSSLLPSAALAAKILRIPVVWHIREQLYHGLWGLRKRCFRLIIEYAADKIIVLSEAGRNQFCKLSKISVIYNFVDFQYFDRCIDGATIRKKLGIPCTAKVIGFMGGSLPHKGGLILLEAMKYVYRHIPEAHLIILGNTSSNEPSKSKIKRKVRPIIEKILNVYTPEQFNSKLETISFRENIHLVGIQTNIPEWIAACDLIVFPSTCDHFGRPIIEAGAMAKPVVASDWPSTREIVKTGVTGILVQPNNPLALGKAVMTILQDEQKAQRQSMGEAGYMQALDKFNSALQVKKIIKVYESV